VVSSNSGLQFVTHPTAQAVSSSSQAHSAQLNVPPPGTPLADPLSERDHEAEERGRLSCWNQAVESLRTGRPDVYAELEKINKDPSQNEPADLLEFAESKMRKNKKIPRVIESIIRSILQFKEVVAAAANFDPHKIAPIVWRGFCVILEVSCSVPDSQQPPLSLSFYY
jgi:hypothetical protein